VPERTGISEAGGRPAVPSACRPQPTLTHSRRSSAIRFEKGSPVPNLFPRAT